MSRKSLIFGLVLSMAVVSFSSAGAAYQPGQVYHGFKLLEKRFVKEVNAECLYFEHEGSGARLLKIVADDANKTFSIAFKTDPETDAGTPHIMEHSVLNGSKHFPVKSPFDVLSQGSLNTFLNAMTGSDMTIYPVASMNDQDYFNLMHVYLDAVFYPLIYSEPKILKQEGWHYELTHPDSAIVYKGVVYNEMKGSFSSASRELYYQIGRNLFPENGYGFESGGYPTAIPQLTEEKFLAFHRRYYHPANSYIFLYGDADLEKELQFIDQEYLANFKKEDVRAHFEPQKPFTAMKRVNAFYASPDDEPTENQTWLALSCVAGRGDDRALVMALQVLTEVLVNQESAPIRLALQEAGIGREVRASIDDTQQNVVTITVQNANPADADRFLNIVLSELQKASEKGLDKMAVEGTINRMEFRLREGDNAQKGLTYNFQALSGWFYADDPFKSLEYEKTLAEIKRSLTEPYLETVIRRELLDNPHSVLVVLEPKPGMEKENNRKVAEELAQYKATLTPEQLQQLVNETEELIAYQQREDTPEALATIPHLEIKDITPKAQWYTAEKKRLKNFDVLHYNTFSNGVVYVNFHFDVRTLPQELVPYAALLAEALGSLSTDKYEYGELDNLLNIHTGGFSVAFNTYLENRSDDKLLPKFTVSTKAMAGKTDKLFELSEEIIDHTRYADPERLKTVLTRHQSRLENAVKQNGFGYTMRRVESYFNQRGRFNELTSGLDYYWFVTDLTKNYEARSGEIIAKLQKTAQLLFNQQNLILGLTCSAQELPAVTAALGKLGKLMPSQKPAYQVWQLQPQKENEGITAASKVQYVLKGYNYKKLGYTWNGKMRVLGQILSTDWLQNQVRVIGGAYGGFSNIDANGTFLFASYRDPNLQKTIETYDNTPGYLKALDIDDKRMTRFIIGTVADLDYPLTPSQRGGNAVRRYFEKITQADLQSERDAVLATTVQDIRGFEKLVTDVLAQDAVCVYGNKEKIEKEAAELKKIIPATR